MIQTVHYFLVWGLLIFAMLRFGCGAHVMGHRHYRHSDQAVKPGWSPPEKDIDPVCGMTVDTRTAKPSINNGHAYHFCSEDYRRKLEASPSSYASAGKRQEPEHSHGHSR